MLKTFEEFLEEKCDEEESDVMSKDNFEDVASRWFENLDTQELIAFGEEYGKYVEYETLSEIGDKITTRTLEAHDELKNFNKTKL